MADLVTFEEVCAHLNIDDDPGDPELVLFIDAATARVSELYGDFPTGIYTETVTAVDDPYWTWLIPQHRPVTAVTSVTDPYGVAYTTGFTIHPDGSAIRHANVHGGQWVVVYTAGEAVPADLKLAVLEDIRGLYQPSQIAPPIEFGAFGTTSPAEFRPVNLWPRIDAWIYSRLGPACA